MFWSVTSNAITLSSITLILLSLFLKLFAFCRYVFARPAGKRCFVVSSHGTTVSRLRNGTMLHRFPSALPSGARKTGASKAGYCILDCIFHEVPY